MFPRSRLPGPGCQVLMPCTSATLFLCSQEDAQEEFGWKLVHGDVFRPPRKGMLLSVFLGSGTQIFIMTFVTLCMFLFSVFSILVMGLNTTHHLALGHLLSVSSVKYCIKRIDG